MGVLTRSPGSETAPPEAEADGAAASLRERERELEEAHRIARLGTWHWVKASDTLTWSAEVYRIYGCDPRLPPPRHDHVRRLMTPESFSLISAALARAFATGEPYVLDLQVVHASGAPRWVVARGEVAARGPDGEVTELRGTVQDITERKLTELALREREEQLRQAHRIARLGTWNWDVASDTTTWSEEVYRAFGLDPEQAEPNFAAIRSMHSAESRARLEAAVQRALSTGEPYELDMELHLADGSQRWIIARGEAGARGPDGKITELRGTIQDITERKQREQQLALSEGRYRSLMKVGSALIWTVDVEGNQMNYVPEWQAFTGQSAEQMLGFGWVEAIHPEDRGPNLEAWRRSVETGEPYAVEQRLRGHDGVYRHMEVRAVPSRDAAGKIVEWVGMHTDITERVEAEAELLETKSRFQKLYEANLMGICYPDKFGAFSDGNEEFLRIVGYTREELQAGLVRWDTMTPPEYAELDQRHIAQAAERGSCTTYEKEYIRKDGERVPILCGYALLEGSEDAYIGFILDISAQKKAEEAVRERERHFRELAESLPELVWVIDVAAQQAYFNRRFLEYTGMSAEEMHAGRGFEIAHPEDRERARTQWNHAMETGEGYTSQLRLRRHDGVYRHHLSRSVPVRDDDGEIQRWIGTATDIHEQQLAEEGLRRTEKLAATGRLAASIAHEINNPLEAVTNALYLALQDDKVGAQTRAWLNTADRELQRVAHVTTQTLRFHRQPRGPAEENLSELMESALGLFERRFEACDVRVEREYRNVDKLLCCGDELRQVFANLLSNALDATRKGGRLRLRIAAAHAWDEGREPGLRVTLGDTGEGIPPQLRGHIFEPFMTTKEATGTGLGLWVSAGIVHKHKGRIALKSRVGQGTVFSMFFPLRGLEG